MKNINSGNLHTNGEMKNMAKAGMGRPDLNEPHDTESNRKTHFPKNDVPPVPKLQDKAKLSKEKVKSV
jgi:hypothetical protein